MNQSIVLVNYHTFHPALQAAFSAMGRSPAAVEAAVVDTVNSDIRHAAEHSNDVKAKTRQAFSYKAGTKAQTVTVKCGLSQSVKLPATPAVALLALNERLEAVREMYCRITDCELPSVIRNWIRESVPTDAKAVAAVETAEAIADAKAEMTE